MLFFNLLARLPFPVLYGVSDFLFFLLHYVIRYRKKVIRENLRNAFPEKSEKERAQIARQFSRNFTDIIVESIKALKISEKEMAQRVSITNPELAQKYFDNGQSFIGLTSHLGNWEWLLLINCIQYKQVDVDAVYKPLSNKFFDKLMYRIRSRFGAIMIKDKEVMRSMFSRADIVRGIALVADQTPLKSETRLWTTFMNQETPFFVGGEIMARKKQLPVLFLSMKRIKRGHYEATYHFLAEPPFDKHSDHFEITEKYVQKLEQVIREQPASWLWAHRRWKHKKDDVH